MHFGDRVREAGANPARPARLCLASRVGGLPCAAPGSACLLRPPAGAHATPGASSHPLGRGRERRRAPAVRLLRDISALLHVEAPRGPHGEELSPDCPGRQDLRLPLLPPQRLRHEGAWEASPTATPPARTLTGNAETAADTDRKAATATKTGNGEMLRTQIGKRPPPPRQTGNAEIATKTDQKQGACS